MRMHSQSNHQQNSRRFPFWGATFGHDPRDSYSVRKSSIFDSGEANENNNENDGKNTGSDSDSLLSNPGCSTYDTTCQISASLQNDFTSRVESATEYGGTSHNRNDQGFESLPATTDASKYLSDVKSKVALDLFALVAFDYDSKSKKRYSLVENSTAARNLSSGTITTTSGFTSTSISSIGKTVREYDVDSKSDDVLEVFKDNSNLANPIVDELTQKMSQLWFHRISHQATKNTGQLFEKGITNPAALDKVQAREMLEMSVDEREAINNEIHGVQSRAVPENPSMIATALLSLRQEIDDHIDEEILDKDNSNPGGFTKEAYKRGLELNSVYIQSDDFRIRFLRKSLFDVRDAALQFFRYLDWIQELFGDVALMRPLFLSDLTKRELKYFKNGQQQLFPSQDRAGRRIYAFLGCNNTAYSVKEKYRVQAYLFDVLAQDEQCQKLGFIYIGMIQRSGKVIIGGKKDARRMLVRSNNACPCRWAAFHLCFPDTLVFNFVQAVTFLVFNKNWRPLVRYHSGSQVENNYHLCGYGIPSSDIPMTFSGKVKTKNLTRFLHARTSIESYQKKEIQKEHFLRYGTTGPVQCLSMPHYPGVECPDRDSVVFGDKKMYDHPGNVRFRTFLRGVEQQRMVRIANYDETLSSVVNFVHEIMDDALSPQHNFQFYSYSRDDFLYKEYKDRNELHRRVHQALRDLRKRSRPAETVFLTTQTNNGKNESSPDHVTSLNRDNDKASTNGLCSYKRTKT